MSIFKVQTEWALRDVVRVQCCNELLKLTWEIVGPEKGFLSFYQAALSAFMKNLSEEVRVKLEALGRKWNEKAPLLCNKTSMSLPIFLANWK